MKERYFVKMQPHYWMGAIIGLVLTVASGTTAKAQISEQYYWNVDWQFNAAANDGFAQSLNGWGMNIEGAWCFTPNVSAGAFLGFHSNNKYYSRETVSLGNGEYMNTDRTAHYFQLPFGVMCNYRFIYSGMFRPYVGAKMGVMYSEFQTAYNLYEINRDTWGFYIAPELGLHFYPMKGMTGVHLALYYNFSTNKTDEMPGFDISGIGNYGFRVGIAL